MTVVELGAERRRLRFDDAEISRVEGYYTSALWGSGDRALAGDEMLRKLRRLFLPKVSSTYDRRFEQVLRCDRPGLPQWVHFPFECGTEEGMTVLQAIWAVESRQWERYLDRLDSERVPGDVVEFGVSVGNSAEQFLDAMEKRPPGRRFWGFDSFEGLPKPSLRDPPHWTKGEFAADYDVVRERLRIAERPWAKLVKGWFSETLRLDEVTAIDRIAFARIDCDLYDSTIDCLSFLEGRLSDGAFLLFDDWTDDDRTGETRAFFEWEEKVRGVYRFEFLMRIALGGFHVRVRHR